MILSDLHHISSIQQTPAPYEAHNEAAGKADERSNKIVSPNNLINGQRKLGNSNA